MREYIILLPNNRNDGTPQPEHTHSIAQTAMLDTFGGFTLYNNEAVGGWVSDDGTRYLDSLRVYGIATDDDFLIRTVAESFAILYEQECIYVRNPDNSVDLIYATADVTQPL